MAIEQLVTCDLCGAGVIKAERNRFKLGRVPQFGYPVRFAIRRNQDRPESAEYLDIGPCCSDRSIGELVKRANENRPEDASGYKA